MPIDGPGELSVRTATKGGGVAASVRELHGTAAGSRRMIIFIHGFANNQHKANRSYKQMYLRLADWKDLSPVRLRQVWWFYWPGDVNAPVVNQLSYPWQISRAKQSASLLATFLLELSRAAGRALEVLFVAHSLGNRVMLETIREIESLSGRARERPIIRSTVLMAAAIPDRYCEPNGPLPKGDPTRIETNLYSRLDKVLKYAFRMGQTAAGEGFFPVAVGYSGKPSSRWSSSFVTNYGHGDYWSGRFSSQQVSRIFGAIPERATLERPLPESAVEEHELAEARQLPGSDLNDLYRRTTLGKY